MKGLEGTLSSKGKFSGPLNYLKVEGTTDTPDFSLRTTDEPVALHTDFSAVVDGTNGNTYLQSITARFRNTTLAVSGKVVDIDPEVRGRTILLDADSVNARVEDLIRLAVKTADPVMTGSAWLRTEINISEGNSDLIERLRLKGQFGIGGENKTQCRLVLAFVPQPVKLRGDILEIEGDTVRFVRLGCGLAPSRSSR